MDIIQQKIDEVIAHVRSMQSHLWDDGGLTRDSDYEELEDMLRQLVKLSRKKCKAKK